MKGTKDAKGIKAMKLTDTVKNMSDKKGIKAIKPTTTVKGIVLKN